MIGWIQRLGFLIFQEYLRGKMLGGARRQGLLIYFRAVNGLRRLLVTLAIIGVLLHLMVIALVGSIVTLTWILIPDERVRLFVLLGGFVTLFALPLAASCLLLSERFWLRLSGAENLIEGSSEV